MKSLMETALGDDWKALHPALQAHYRCGRTIDRGHLDIEFPRHLQPVFSLLRAFGILLDRRGQAVATEVVKEVVDGRQRWYRTITYGDGRQIRFDSVWVAAGGNQLIEFVKPWLGLQLAAWVDGGSLRYRGVRYVARVGRWQLSLPNWLFGRATIAEEGVDAEHFAMDFRLTHPLFGEIYRYAGTFAADIH